MQKIAILYDASQAVLSTFDLDEVLNRILTIIRDFFQLQNGAVLLMDKSQQELQVRAHLGRSNLSVGYRIPKGTGLTWAAAEIKRPVYAPDVTSSSGHLFLTKSEAIRSCTTLRTCSFIHERTW